MYFLFKKCFLLFLEFINWWWYFYCTGFSYNGICYIKDKIILIVTGSLNIILFKYINFEYIQKNQKIKVILI